MFWLGYYNIDTEIEKAYRMRQLILIISLLFFCLPLTAQQTLTPADILTDIDSLVSELPNRLLGWEIDTPQGMLAYNFDAPNAQFIFQHEDEADIQKILLPDNFKFENQNSLTVSPDGLNATICNYRWEPSVSWVAGEAWSINFQDQSVGAIGTCHYDFPNWGLPPDASYSGATYSLDKVYKVIVEESDFFPPEGCIDEFRRLSSTPKLIIVQNVTSEKRVVAGCTFAEKVEFLQWVDSNRLTIQIGSTHDSNPPVQQLLLLSTTKAELLSLNRHVQLYPSVYFFDNNTKAARLAIRDDNEYEPYDCTLNIIDFVTGESVHVEPTRCLQQPEIHVDEENKQLIYIYHQVTDNPFQPVSTPHRVNLNTLDVTPASISGSFVDIDSIAPDGTQITLTVDEGDTYVNDVYTDITRHDNPRWIVFEFASDAVVYEKPLLEINDSYDRPLYYDGIGTIFTWTDSGWRALLQTDDKSKSPAYIASEKGEVIETRLDQLPPDESYFGVWSPDQSQLLIRTDTNAAYVLNAADQTVQQVFQPFDPGLSRVNVEWQGNLLLLEISKLGTLTTQVRWLIDPAKE